MAALNPASADPDLPVTSPVLRLLLPVRIMAQREVLLALRRRGETVNPLLFFVVVATLFPLALGPQPTLLAQTAPGVLWVGALLATLLSLERLFRDDLRDGSLEQISLSGHSLPLLMLGKLIGHWLTTGLPLVLAAPLLGLLLHLPVGAQSAMFASLLLGTPVLTLVGGIGVALTATLARGGVLLAVLVLPLYVPVLVFGVAATGAAVDGTAVLPHLALLGSLLCLAALMAPVAVAAAVRLGLR